MTRTALERLQTELDGTPVASEGELGAMIDALNARDDAELDRLLGIPLPGRARRMDRTPRLPERVASRARRDRRRGSDG